MSDNKRGSHGLYCPWYRDPDHQPEGFSVLIKKEYYVEIAVIQFNKNKVPYDEMIGFIEDFIAKNKLGMGNIRGKKEKGLTYDA